MTDDGQLAFLPVLQHMNVGRWMSHLRLEVGTIYMSPSVFPSYIFLLSSINSIWQLSLLGIMTAFTPASPL